MNSHDSVTKVLIAHITKDRGVAEDLERHLLDFGGERLECHLWCEDNRQSTLEDLQNKIHETDLLLLFVANGFVNDEDWGWLQSATIMSRFMSNGHAARILLHNTTLTPPKCIRVAVNRYYSSAVDEIRNFLRYFFGSGDFTQDRQALNKRLIENNTQQVNNLAGSINLLFPQTNSSPRLDTFQKAITLIVDNSDCLTRENLAQEIRIQSQTPGSLGIFDLAETRPGTNDNWSWEDLPSDNTQGWLIELADFIWEAHCGRRREPPVIQSTFQSSDGSLYKIILYEKKNCRDGSERFTVIFVRHFSVEWVNNAPNVSLSTLLTASVLGGRLQWEVCDTYLPELNNWQRIGQERIGQERIRKRLQQVKVSFENIEKDAEFRNRNEARAVRNEVRLRNSFESRDEQDIIRQNMLEQEQYKQILLNADTQDNIDEVRDALTKLKSLNVIVMDMVGRRYSQLLTQLRNENSS